MSDNEIKPVAWRCIWKKSGKPAWEQYHDEIDPIPEEWDCRPNEVRPLYDQPAIDRLTAERDALRAQLDWTVRENDRLLDEGRDSAAERDAAMAIAQAFAEAKSLAAERDPARLVAYDWIESRAAMIAAARAQEPQE